MENSQSANKHYQDIKTKLVHGGRDKATQDRIVNPPVHHASTMLFDSVASLRAVRVNSRDFQYGRMGTSTTQAVEDLISDLEGSHGCVMFPSGLAAICMSLLSVVQAGDHILITQSCYGPTRKFCDDRLANLGVDVEYYEPCIGDGIKELFKPNTKLIFCESPGSVTFEVQDIPAICAAAKANNVLTFLDNTWSTPLYFNGLDHGIDVQITAATKYFSGHADVMVGVVTSRQEEMMHQIRAIALESGQHCAPDDSYLVQRGIRTLSLRLPEHQASALHLANWLDQQDFVLRLLHPAFESCLGHAIWKRDFKGSTGLFGVVVKAVSDEKMMEMIDNMSLFKIGYSWGGYESLVLPYEMTERQQQSMQIEEQGLLLRFHAGLEQVDDLLADMQQGFKRLYS